MQSLHYRKIIDRGINFRFKNQLYNRQSRCCVIFQCEFTKGSSCKALAKKIISVCLRWRWQNNLPLLLIQVNTERESSTPNPIPSTIDSSQKNPTVNKSALNFWSGKVNSVLKWTEIRNTTRPPSPTRLTTSLSASTLKIIAVFGRCSSVSSFHGSSDVYETGC